MWDIDFQKVHLCMGFLRNLNTLFEPLFLNVQGKYLWKIYAVFLLEHGPNNGKIMGLTPYMDHFPKSWTRRSFCAPSNSKYSVIFVISFQRQDQDTLWEIKMWLGMFYEVQLRRD